MERKTKLKKALLITVFLMTVLLIPTVKSEAAAAKPKCEKNVTFYLVESGPDFFTIESCAFVYIKNLASNAQVYDIRSSNNKIIALKHPTMSALTIDYRDELKPGMKTTLSFKVKQNRKVYSLKCNVKFKRSPARFKSLKIGSWNMTAQANKSDFISVEKFGGIQKIEAVPVSGIAIDFIEIFYQNNTSRKIKNGQSISLNNARSIGIYYKHTKKPKYYSSKGFTGMVPSPLHGAISIISA